MNFSGSSSVGKYQSTSAVYPSPQSISRADRPNVTELSAGSTGGKSTALMKVSKTFHAIVPTMLISDGPGGCAAAVTTAGADSACNPVASPVSPSWRYMSGRTTAVCEKPRNGTPGSCAQLWISPVPTTT